MLSHMVIAFQRTGKPFLKLLYLAAVGEVCVSPHNTCLQYLLSVSLIMTTMAGVRWYLIVVMLKITNRLYLLDKFS